MSETRSIRLNASVIPAEEVDEWQRQEIAKGIEDLDAGRTVSHEEIVRELGTWGKRPRQARSFGNDRGF